MGLGARVRQGVRRLLAGSHPPAAAVLLTGLVVLGAAVLGAREVGWLGAPLAAEESKAQHCLDLRTDETGPHAGMVWIPAGSFTMGDTVYPEEGPLRSADVQGFWMDRHEVTNAEFAAFVTATSYVTVAERPVDPATHSDLPAYMLKAGGMVFVMPKTKVPAQNVWDWWKYVPGANWRHPGGPGTTIEGRKNYPVVQLAYEDVQAYARWKGRTLPTEAQWERAARAGEKTLPDHEQPKNANTWQGVFPVLNDATDGFAGMAPVGCYAPNKFGLYDMIGNAWEWTQDLYRVRPNAPVGTGPQDGDPQIARYVIKGGSFLCATNYCMRYRAGAREPQEADLAASHLGFRTIIVPDPKSDVN